MSSARSRLNWPLVSTRSQPTSSALLQHGRVGVSAVTDDLGPRRASGEKRPYGIAPEFGVGLEVDECENCFAVGQFLVQPLYRHDLPGVAPAWRCNVLNAGQEEEVGCYDENFLATRHRRDAGGSGWLCHGETCPYSSSVSSSTISPISTSTGSSLSPAGRIRLTSVLCILACGRMLCNSLSAV